MLYVFLTSHTIHFILFNTSMSPPPCDFVIRIALLNATLRKDDNNTELSPSVWRRFRCSSHLPLDVVHDKVIAPVMGWCRNYHAFLFTNEKGQACMTQESNSNEMMHVRKYSHYNATGSAEDTTLRQLVSKVGDKAYYIYDFGDFWKHVIEVEQVLKGDEAHGRCIILDGAMRCPAEDGEGGASYQRGILDNYNRLLVDPHNKKVAREHANACFHGDRNALNVKSPFRPAEFSLYERQKAIKKAFHSKASVLKGVKIFCSRPGILMLRPEHGQRLMTTEFEDDRCQPSGYVTGQELVNIKPDSGREAVCVCGNPLELSFCAQCRSIRYCSRDCQKKDWRSHKTQCKQEKENREQSLKERKEWKTKRPNVKSLTIVGPKVSIRKWKHPLRFEVGTLVECQISGGTWAEGRITESPYRHGDGTIHPYQILIDPSTCIPGVIPDGVEPVIFALWDDDMQVRKVPSR